MDWKREINLAKNETLGLDIGSSAVKMVALRKNGEGYSAIAAGIVEIAASDDGDESRRIRGTENLFEPDARVRRQVSRREDHRRGTSAH